MAISISSRIRNAMVGLSVSLCVLFGALIFLFVYVIEDQIFINQIKVEKRNYEESDTSVNWRPVNANMRIVQSADDLPDFLTPKVKASINQQKGVHEYFDDDHAVFIAHLARTGSNDSYFIIYDVRSLLAVRGSRLGLFAFIGLFTLLIIVASVFLARRLTRSTLKPVRQLSNELQTSDIDDLVIELASEFSDDEVGVLAHELALALRRVRDSARREYEFNRGVSHELRSPIQVAQSATELLELKATGDDEALLKPIARLKRSVSEMNEIVEAFLWMASDRELTREDSCSIAVLRNLVSVLQQPLAAVEIRLSTELAPEFDYHLPVPIMAVIVRSLIRNSLSHGDGERVEIVFEQKLISVTNACASNSQDTSGFGVGLAIVQRICDRFDCRLIIGADQENSFSVSIELP